MSDVIELYGFYYYLNACTGIFLKYKAQTFCIRSAAICCVALGPGRLFSPVSGPAKQLTNPSSVKRERDSVLLGIDPDTSRKVKEH